MNENAILHLIKIVTVISHIFKFANNSYALACGIITRIYDIPSIVLILNKFFLNYNNKLFIHHHKSIIYFCSKAHKRQDW